MLDETFFEQIPRRERGIEFTGFSGSEKAYLIASLFLQHRVSCLVIVSSTKQGEQLVEDLRFFIGNSQTPVMFFPPYNILPFKFLSYHNEIAGNRIRVLYQLLEETTPSIVVITVEALLKKIIPRPEISRYAELLIAGEEIERDYLITKLISGGYTKTAVVEEPGDFSVRGGIIDIFSPLYEDPLRIEFYGDLVESMRFFSASSQRKFSDVNEAVILPAREVILDNKLVPNIISRIRALANELDVSVTHARSVIDKIKNYEELSGIESLIPLIYPKLDTIFDYIPQNSLVIAIDPDELEKAANEMEESVVNNYTQVRDEKKLCLSPEELYLKWSEAAAVLSERKPLVFKTLDVLKIEDKPQARPYRFKAAIENNTDLSIALKNLRDREHLFQPLVEWLTDRKRSGNATLVACRNESQADRLNSLLTPYGIQSVRLNGFARNQLGRGQIYICIGQVSSGFVWPNEYLALITDDEIFGVRKQRRKYAPPRPAVQLLDMQELKKDDLIVHNDHGIGQYGGLAKLTVDGLTNDFLIIVYQGGDKLYLPVDRMSVVQKYMGVDGITPVLDSLGGKSWERVKSRVKRSAEKIAGELLKLYARRQVDQGNAFSAPDNYFQDFESGFAYEETADQQKAIEEVLADMQRPTPMDRLVCGDVGYGKTEVALRASFLAVNDGKQVALLVPTTILAEQHYATFCSRFDRYPVNIACLSRFRSPRVQRAIVNDLKEGKIDIVIGTHRLLQKDVAFKDLGLLVLDEEQRFGVKHKEKLKRLRSTVDVLALTATPIPRTLHLSLVGVRDISVISTPPEYRKSIITYISEFDEAVVADSVRKELKRQGQIFFVHNNIHSIDKMAAKLKRLVPEVNLAVAHGRMDEDQLEEVMFLFMNKEIDMLVCTTIIESGLDIASANTIIVNRADRFGLAQMYQLRGRVGRSDEQAYAYLLIPHESLLGKDARKRLKVLMEHSDLGSGFQIAMSDLKIRGGGTILGASQSGHIAAVGYDMFLKLMESAMAELKGEATVEPVEPEINVNMSALLAEHYIPDIDQRMAAYRRLAKMTELQQISDFKSELIDRFGPLPDEATNLLFKIVLKVLAKKAGVSRLDMANQNLILYFSEMHQRNPAAMIDMIIDDSKRFQLSPEGVLKARLTSNNFNAHLAQTKNILKEIAQRVNG
ncbi:MAG: transcription-repair coupling factor [Desulfobacterales bacterium]|nr:MAG: transcription-repair coupling factor [Desulfobacterales bacterium]